MAAVACQDVKASSLPQGWHASPTRTGTSRPTTAVAPTVKPMTAPAPRRQWNAVQRHAPSTEQRRRNVGSSENERPSRTSTAIVERLRTEVAALQRTITNFRAENQSLKAKAKRLEEESLRRARQIDKLVLASEQTKSVAASEKKKDGEAMNLLKQKCLKLERSLREKENALRRIHSAEKHIPRTQASQVTSLPQTRRQMSKELPHKATGVSSSTLEVELSRLRDSLHRLTEENRRMAQHLKEKEQELRQLKQQLRQRTTAHETFATRRTGARSTVSKERNRAGSATLETKQQRVASLPKRSNTFNVGKRTAPGEQRHGTPASVDVRGTDTYGQNERKKSVGESSDAVNPSVGPVRHQEGVTGKPSGPSAGKMREEVAATKIQRTWRDHRKRKTTKSAEASLEGSQLSSV